MSDVRQSTAVLDDFNRANEEPLSGGGNWAQTDTLQWWWLRLLNNKATTRAGLEQASSYWTPDTFDGDAAEAWGWASDGAANGIRWGIALFRDAGTGNGVVDGYRFSLVVGSAGSSWNLQRYANGTPTLIDSTVAPSGAANSPGYMLIRRKGNEVEGWWDQNAAGTNFTQVVGATDTTYTTGFSLALTCADSSGLSILAWDYFGGGGTRNRPQIYRWVSN